MAFEFRILIDNVSDSVFPGIRHLNWMDKIAHHSNEFESSIPKFQGLGFEGLGLGGLEHMGLGGLGLKSLEGIESSP